MKMSRESGSSTIVAALAMSVSAGICLSLYQMSENDLRLSSRNKAVQINQNANLSALQTASDLFVSGAITVVPKNTSVKGTSPANYTFSTSSKSPDWKLSGSNVIFSTCNPKNLSMSEKKSSGFSCGDSDLIVTNISMKSIDLVTNTAEVSADSSIHFDGIKKKIVTNAVLGLKKSNCDNFLTPAKGSEEGFLANATWAPNGHGPGGNSSLVWVYPSLYPGKFVGNNYEFEFYVYWAWKRENLNGFTVGNLMAGQAKTPPGTFGTGSKPKYITSYYDIVRSFCGLPQFNNCGSVAYDDKCLSGNSCNRHLIKGTMVDAKLGSCDPSKLILTAIGFSKRTAGGGCFPPTARVTLANGKLAYIGSLVVGDEVFNPILKKSAKVLKVVGGEEKFPLLKVTVGGQTIDVTSGHPFMTTSGMIRADLLAVGQEVLQADGSFSKIDQIDVDYSRIGQDVMNISIEGDDDPMSHMIEVEGVVVGDLFLQQKLELKKP